MILAMVSRRSAYRAPRRDAGVASARQV